MSTSTSNNNNFSIYVAGSSAELARAQGWIDALTAHDIKVTSSWPTVITQVGDANPAVDDALRRKYALDDFAQIDAADVLWLLVPTSSPGRGAYAELGYAYAQHKVIACSGATDQSIFTSLGRCTPYDAEAFGWMLDLRTRAGLPRG